MKELEQEIKETLNGIRLIEDMIIGDIRPIPESDVKIITAYLMRLLNKYEDVINAAILYTYCPDAGGYWDGKAVEDTCEGLSEAVYKLTGKVEEYPCEERWGTEEEMWDYIYDI